MTLETNSLVKEERVTWHQFHQVMCQCVRPSPTLMFDDECVIGKRTAGLEEEFPQPTALTDQDVEKLEELLFRLPKLRGMMSQAEMDDFLQKYRALPDRPEWEPVLRDEAAQEQMKTDAFAFRNEHLARTEKWRHSGKLQLTDKDGHPGSSLLFSFITKSEAAKYLERCQIDSIEQIFRTLGFSVAPATASNSEKPTSAQNSAQGLTEVQPLTKSLERNATLPIFPPIGAVMEDYVRTEQAAYYLKRQAQTLRGWASRRDGPILPKHSGRLLLWSIADIQSILK